MPQNISSVFTFTPGWKVTEEVKNAFNINGYILVKGLLDGEETTKLQHALENDEGVLSMNYGRDDGEGRKTKVVLWNQPGNDITGVIARTNKLAGTFAELLGGEVYHYHSKVIMKEAHTGGAHIWHQDYGYWYHNGCMFPNMGTAWLAVDRATTENGCLKILKGSHLLGRIDHTKVGDQAGADLERVKQAEKFCQLVHVEVDPGDCLFFHCNMLHRSDQNNSDKRRWAFLVAYNRADNDPVYDHHHPKYSPLNMLPDSAIKGCNTVTDMTGKDFFLGPKEDVSVHNLEKASAK